jgi:hypothetical protein
MFVLASYSDFILKCPKPSYPGFTIDYFRKDIIGGTWEYKYSYTDDTCLVLPDLIDPPSVMVFKNVSDSSIIKNKDILKIKQSSVFKNISCTLTDKWGNKHLTTIVTSSRIPVDSITDHLMVYHLSIANDHIKREYELNVNGIKNDTLYLQSDRLFGISDKNPEMVKHLFVRRK